MARFGDAVRAVFNATLGSLSTQHSVVPVRAGVIGATGTVVGSYARGLLPRSVKDQALATGVALASNYLLIATASAAAETLALYATGDRTVRDRRAPTSSLLMVSFGFVAAGLAVDKALPPHPDEPLPESLVRFAGHYAALGGAATTMVAASDALLRSIPATRDWGNRSLLADAALGGSITLAGLVARRQRARRYGLVDPDRPALAESSPAAKLKAVGAGAGAAVGLLALARTEQVVAHRVTRLFYGYVGKVQVGSPWLGHLVALGLFGAAGTALLSRFKARTESRGDVHEPAYPAPPSSPHVTAGPNSLVSFDHIGREGRRFVLMTLRPAEIEAVMGAPALPPVRVVAGFESTDDTVERARLCLAEMEALGAFDRSLICVAAPTGVGYVSYVFAETLEYLTLGDCAIVVPQYALVPSVLALNDTRDGVRLQRLVLEGINARVAAMPPELRPTVVQFGESLGAQVALEVAFPDGTDEFHRLGLSGGLYLGVPFRTRSWNAWVADPAAFDPPGQLVLVAEPAELATVGPAEREAMNHLMVVHHDDPVNKFGYRTVVRPPWWLGAPETRPPKVPRETRWMPVTTFILTLVDLKNGMSFAPGNFLGTGHDYRLDVLAATRAAYRLRCSDTQAAAIEDALRRREMIWAQRRLVARKFQAARDSVAGTLKKWGVPTSNIPDSIPLDAMPGLDSLFGEAATEVLDSTVGAHAETGGANPATTSANQPLP